MVSVIRVWATETVRIDTLGCIFKKIMNIFKKNVIAKSPDREYANRRW